VRTLLSRVPHHADVAVILNPRVTPVEFLLTICEELGLGIADADRDSVKQMVDALNRRLLAAHAEGRRIIVIVDEAQNLSAEVLEQVRLLTNLETPTQKLLQIILIGQPELRELLDRTDLRQLAQRITGRYHLEPLSREETRGYVRHRLRVAGAVAPIFTPAALTEVHRLAGGIPRVINVTCDRALLGAYTQETRKVSTALVRQAAGEVYGRWFMPSWLGWFAAAVGAACIAAAAFGGCRGASEAGGGKARTSERIHQRPARRQQRQHRRCRCLPPPALALGNGDGGRQGPLWTSGQGGIVMSRPARLLGASQSFEPARHPDFDRR
jgi:general secretion pathway protein A